MDAETYIGTRRLQVVDKKWNGDEANRARVLEDSGSSLEDIDRQGTELEMAKYRRGDRNKTPVPTGPEAPDIRPRTGAQKQEPPKDAPKTDAPKQETTSPQAPGGGNH
jgi:hypothetical protein